MFALLEVTYRKDSRPIAMWQLSVLLDKAYRPIAVLYCPVVLPRKAPKPIAVLYCPVVLLSKATLPIATLRTPVVLLYNAD